MANFKSAYNHDKIAAEEGVWAPIGYGVKVKVRAFDSAHTKALRKKLEAPFSHLTRVGKPIPDDEQNEINTKLVAYSSLLDWNLTEDDASGALDVNANAKQIPIPFNGDRAYAILEEEPVFLRDVIAVLMSADTFKKKEFEDDAKNSVSG
jgi:hypothetical protein